MENTIVMNDSSESLSNSDTVSSEVNVVQQGNEVQNQNMILGKFKSVDDLATAYKNMESQQGQQSKELGELRKKAEVFDTLQKQFIERNENLKAAKDYFDKVVPKYMDKEQYFKNPEFSQLYQEAFNALGTNLDTDKFISMLDKYVDARLTMHQKAQAAKTETENAKSQMQFSNSDAKNDSQPKLQLDSLTAEEIDAYVAKYI